jgi:hypothetical protein
MPHHRKTAIFGCCDCGLNPSDPSDPLPMEPGARRGGWSRALKYCWPFIATEFDVKQLDGTLGVHRPGTCVYGMLWMDKTLGPEIDHSAPWHRGRTTKTKYRCPLCHQAKTTVENKRRLDKLFGIERSPTADVELEDASTSYDVDTHARGKAYVDIPWSPADIIFIETHFAVGTGALVHPQTLQALTVPQLLQRMIDAKFPQAESRTEVQLKRKCHDMRQEIVHGTYKYPDQVRGSGKGRKDVFSPRELAFIEENRGRGTNAEILAQMKDKFPESAARNVWNVCQCSSKTNKNKKQYKKGKPSLEQIAFVEEHVTTPPCKLLKLLNDKFSGGYTYTKNSLQYRLTSLKASAAGGGGSSSKRPVSRSGGVG